MEFVLESVESDVMGITISLAFSRAFVLGAVQLRVGTEAGEKTKHVLVFLKRIPTSNSFEHLLSLFWHIQPKMPIHSHGVLKIWGIIRHSLVTYITSEEGNVYISSNFFSLKRLCTYLYWKRYTSLNHSPCIASAVPHIAIRIRPSILIAGALSGLTTSAVVIDDRSFRACTSGVVTVGTVGATRGIRSVVVGAGLLAFGTLDPDLAGGTVVDS